MPTQTPLNDRTTVDRQYGSTDGLVTRRSVWGPGPEGVSPVDLLRDAVLRVRPGRALEIGCGTGHFAASVVAALPGVTYVATDSSRAMVGATAARGVEAHVADAGMLPFPDDCFDLVVAAWMLYHVGDLDTVLAEVTRVLAPGGTFLAATNGDEHAADLLREAGGSPVRTQFSSENGAASLRRHFDLVSRRDVETLATFPDHAAAVSYLASFDPELAAGLPRREGPRLVAGHTTVFTAR